jgi:hypothetical protein
MCFTVKDKMKSFISKLLFVITVIFLMSAEVSAEFRRIAETASPDGRIRAWWQVSPAEPQLSDTILLTLEIQADTSFLVESPTFAKALGDLEIIDVSEQIIEARSDRETRQIVLKVVPKHGGKTPIWQTPIRYSNRHENLQDKPYSITLPAAELEIKAAVSPENASLEKVTKPQELFDIRSGNRIHLIFFLIFLIVVVFFLFFYFRRRLERTPSQPTLSPQEIALQRLVILMESRLHESDVKKFFIELTSIVRWYIEQQTEIRAPELTTEEFLHEMTLQWDQQSILPLELQNRLQLFLESADMVKFARFQPLPEEIMLGVQRAKEFITLFRHCPEIT